MTGYKALEGAVSTVREYGGERAALLNEEYSPAGITVKTPLLFLIPFPGNPSRNKKACVKEGYER
jgi:hypothetical protein